MKKGDKLRCKRNIENIVGWRLYTKNNVYEVLDVEDDLVYLNHELFANEYFSNEMEFIKQNFITLKEERKLKLKKLKNV